ncbi:flagellar motor switch protein FliN [Buchnera aphidicola (Rhopalosiphum padi)]|uniref:Flagellar motor switch protein FliN n=1 Tax=Buchnera aphidicola subsp. Rhopalosiphum padi TaxID=98793 RepID=A0A4D6Y5M1_BUCRP|nr:FliM/FliN family flagellar motor switch protein [Buchnera aphidicola]QCI24737.1 flagellar motor switch protein FliN [Buchnera aphidicola (Rhopalosiphum padi)]
MNKVQKKDNFNKFDNDNIKKNNDKNFNKDLIDEDKRKKLNSSNNELSDEKKILFDIAINMTIELGKSKVKLKDLLNFSKGSMLFLTRKKEDPLKIFANNKLIALGEIVFLDNKYGIRIISMNDSFNYVNTPV